MGIARTSIVRGVAVLGVGIIVLAGALAFVLPDDEPNAQPAPVVSTETVPSPAVAAYFVDAKTALSPLLLYVRALPTNIKALQEDDGAGASASTIRQMFTMAEAFATARDLVGRIAVPAQAPAGAGELLQIASQLYRQSALAVTELSTVEAGEPGRAVLDRALQLQILGDRVIDQVRRVLQIDAVGPEEAPIEYQYPPPVPAISDVTGADRSVAGTSTLEQDLEEARAFLEDVSANEDYDPKDSDGQQFQDLARRLENAAGSLDSTDQGEDVLAARLALVLAIVATEAREQGQDGSVDALLMISNDLWNQARTLTASPHREIAELDEPSKPRSEVWVGGDFDGSPPPLAPGEDIGSGLPGGLPEIDPTEILKG